MTLEPLEGRCLLSGAGLSIPAVPTLAGPPIAAVVQAVDRLAAPLSGVTTVLTTSPSLMPFLPPGSSAPPHPVAGRSSWA